MTSLQFLNTPKYLWSNLFCASKLINHRSEINILRSYAQKSDDGCRRAAVDTPPTTDPNCPEPCDPTKKKKGILHRIKLKMIEGGTNFGTPFRRLECEKKESAKDKKKKESEPVALPAPKQKVLAVPPPRPGVQVSILGADSTIGQYVAFLLKQCPCIKKLRLYQATNTNNSDCNRTLCSVVEDLKNINTNCLVQAFGFNYDELGRCLQNTDIVLMLDINSMRADLALEDKFCMQAPLVKTYADCIARECPKAFIVVCASPVDCMVPLVAETLKETGWYDSRKLLGSLAVPEMRASTLAARALGLDPSYTRVPCVCGTEGVSLVPLFSKAVEYFEFSEQNALMMTETVRSAPVCVTRSDASCIRAAELSEAHALAGLVTNIAHALLCHYVPKVTGFVETDSGQVISPARFIANKVEITGSGITKQFSLPKMSDTELILVDHALNSLSVKSKITEDWYIKYCSSSTRLDACKVNFFSPRSYDRFDDCAYANI